jgi:hypothetical protein
MKQKIGNVDYGVDFQHQSVLRATVTQLGLPIDKCEEACISDSSCAIATYDMSTQSCVYKTVRGGERAASTIDDSSVRVITLNGDVYPDFKPKVVSFIKVLGTNSTEAFRRSSEISRLLQDATDQKIKLTFEEKWRHNPNSRISNVMYSWPPDIRSNRSPTNAQILACAAKCDEATGCESFVIRHDTSAANVDDAICGLTVQKYKPEWVENYLNVSTYERKP